ncbi:DUF47 domain-containing protein [Oleisolibacter albus]|uniref:DUF47 domain-containing protein n=1 Tax=Oleisolibacter albus TaxID=2171757 RepID=UPI000DF1E3E5|nr:DUF47 family protein [Oleisolibacter albus]
MPLSLFRRLMPKEERFVTQFAAHAGLLVEAAEALQQLMAAPAAEHEDRQKGLAAIEERADEVCRDVTRGLHRSFITPFDRSDILALINALDDAVDLIYDVPRQAALYGISEFDTPMRELAALSREGARVLAEIIPMLGNVAANATRIAALCARVDEIETAADEVLRRALKALIATRPDAIAFFGTRELYDKLEGITDCCQDAADLIQGIVLDHA